jgi:fumarylpyruvate hydrolase
VVPRAEEGFVSYIFPVPEWPSVDILDKIERFPVNRIFCVGRNFVEHAKEMGIEVDREAPFYFQKSHVTLTSSGARIPYAPGTTNLHHEMEFVVAIGAPAFQIDKKDADSVVYGYAGGLDITRRDLQLKERAKQRPWDLGKDFEYSAVMSAIVSKEAFGAIGDQAITLSVNGIERQHGRLSELVWSIPELIADLSCFYHLVPGDLIFTGTPAGVGPVVEGDVIVGQVDGLPQVELEIARSL